MRGRGPPRRLVLAGLLAASLLLAAATGAAADDRIPIPRDGPADPGDPAIAVSTLRGPATEGGGWGFFRLDLENEDSEPHAVAIEVVQGPDVLATRTVSVPARGRARTWMPCPPGGSAHLLCRVGGGPPATVWGMRTIGAVEIGVLVREGVTVDLEPAAGLRLARVGPVRGPRGSKTCVSVRMGLSDLPPTWTWLTGAAAVVLDAGVPGLEDAARQRVLLDYVEAGGFLAVLDAASLPKGPLADALGSEVPAEGRRGLGGWILRREGPAGPAVADTVADAWLGEDGAPAAEVVPAALAVRVAIPGLGRVPVRAFFFLLLGFAVLVGPVAYLVLRRRRRLMLMTVVVPATGLAFAAAILLYGLVGEGLGTRGVLRSFTVLDQRSHEAVSVANRTLYAGWSPASLRLSPDTVLSAPREETRWPSVASVRTRADPSMRLDVDAGRLDGSLLPSRTLTGLATTTQGKARDRLRFRRSKEGYDVLPSDGFGPDLDAGPVLLRDAGGRYHLARSSTGPMEEASPEEARDLATLALATWSEYEVAREEEDPILHARYAYFFSSEDGVPDETRALRDWLGRRAGEIPPGSYLAWTRRAPVFDDLGLDVDWKAERHLVLGLLGPDDVEGEAR